jgi:nucleotide-binding universal stress UspA family protein
MTVKTILVGVDDTPGSLAALRWAAELAEPLRARVVLLHVFEPLAHVGKLAPGTDLVALRERTATALRGAPCDDLRRRGIEHELLVREGLPIDVLVDTADEIAADLIVVGARRLGRLQALVLGSTSSRLAQRTARPVVVLHGPAS